jgi:hypothetical protein
LLINPATQFINAGAESPATAALRKILLLLIKGQQQAVADKKYPVNLNYFD